MLTLPAVLTCEACKAQVNTDVTSVFNVFIQQSQLVTNLPAGWIEFGAGHYCSDICADSVLGADTYWRSTRGLRRGPEPDTKKEKKR